MVQYCVAYGCKERSSRGTSVSFHGFPCDETVRKKWELNLRRKDFQVSKHSRLCSKHFTPECFDIEAFGTGRKLKKGSVPTIFDFSEPLQAQRGKKKILKETPAASSNFYELDISTKTPTKYSLVCSCHFINEIKENGPSMLPWLQFPSTEIKKRKSKERLVDETENATISCSNSSEIDIKEEDPFSDMTSQDDSDNNLRMGIKSEPDDNCDMVIKTEIKSEPPSPEEVAFSAVKNEQIEIEEFCWSETSLAGTSAVFDELRDGDSPSVKLPRLCTEAVAIASSSLLPSADDLPKDHPEVDVTKTAAIGQLVPSEQFAECSDEGKTLYLKQKKRINKCKRSHKCDVCEKTFFNMSHLKRHGLIHGSERPYKCDICQRCFTCESHLKSHIFIHMERKPYKCITCDKSFIRSSSLKLHSWIHDGNKPYECEICQKRFTRVSNLKVHNLIHEGKKPHKCQTCEKSFTQLSQLKVHNLIHEGKKPHVCKICQKRFTLPAHLKQHSVIHTRHKAT